MMQSAFGIRGLLWDVCRWTGYDSFQVIRSFQGISTAGTPLTLAPQTHSLQWTRRSDFTSKMAKLGGTKRSCQNLKQHKVTQTLWLIWWFVFLFDVYILWVCICLLCYTLTCLYIYIHMYIYDECFPLKWFLRHRWRCFLLVFCHVKREDWMAWDCSCAVTYCPGTYV